MDSRPWALRSDAARAAALTGTILCLLAAVAGCGGGNQPDPGTTVGGSRGPAPRPGGAPERPANRAEAPSEEYRVARAVRGYLAAFTEGEGEGACSWLAPERQRELVEQLAKLPKRRGPPSCERAILLQGAALPGADLERLARSRVTKVALQGETGTAEVLTPTKPGEVAESHTVAVKKIGSEWRLASNFFPGGLRGGRVPRPPPAPARNPAEERKIAAVFKRFRRALERGDGRERLRAAHPGRA